MKFFDKVGKLALGTRLRFLGEKMGEDSASIYKAYGVELLPKWFPVFYVLSLGEEKTIKRIAEEIGHSHASVSKIVEEMLTAGLVTGKTDAKDRRRTMVGLSKTGKQITKKMEQQYIDVNAAIEDISAEASHDLWAALEEWNYLLDQKSLLARVLEKKKQRESLAVKIESYQPKYQKIFRKLNEQWIKTYFKMEKPDYDALDNPQSYIIDRGGFIFVATVDKTPVGVCALIKRESTPQSYELAKMAVAPEARGKNIGWLLGQSIVTKARDLGAEHLFVESNTALKPAIQLYRKLGFKKIVGPPTPYQRCNIQMEMYLN